MNDRQRLEAIVSIVCRYLPPDGIPVSEAMSQIIALVDPLPAPVQEPDGYVYGNSYWEATNPRITDDVKRFGSPRYATPPAQQKPWVDLTDEEIMAAPENLIACIAHVRNKLKEKNT